MTTAVQDVAVPVSKMQELLNQEAFFQIPKLGDLVTGTVISATNSEVHVDLNGVMTGVIQGYELHDESGEYGNLKAGDEVTATVVSLENETGEMELSFREASHKKAWDKLKQLMDEKTVVQVEITDANRGGLMIRFGQTVGFLPVSQLTPEHYPRVEGGDKRRILEILNGYIGMKMDALVFDVNEAENKLIVSEKAAWEIAQRETFSKYKIGTVVEGRVSGVVDFGAFVEFDNGLEGLVHISELGWQRIDNPHDYIKKGQTVKAQIIDIQGSKISLSIKKTLADPWTQATKKYTVGQVVNGKVVKLNPFGIFVELDPEIQGLAHISELSEKKIANPTEVVKVGEAYDFKIISIEPTEHRLGLSLKALKAKATSTEEAPAEEKTEAKAEVAPAEPAGVEPAPVEPGTVVTEKAPEAKEATPETPKA